jgi:hypothetical protein
MSQPPRPYPFAQEELEIGPIVTARPLYHRVREFLWSRPRLYRFVNWARGRQDFYSPDFDICLAGFPRSANTYCQRMLQVTQGELVVRSHRHHPPVAIRALELGKPVVLLVRNPRECIPSFCIHQSKPVDRVIDYYIAFHRIVLPHCDRMFLATHEEVTTNFKGFVQRLNDHYGLGLTTDFNEASAKKEAFRLIRKGVQLPNGKVDHRRLHIPTKKRSPERARLLRELKSEKLRPYLNHADEIYARLLARIRTSGSPEGMTDRHLQRSASNPA